MTQDATQSSPVPTESGIITTYRDDAVRIQDDLFAHINGTWLRDAPISADRAVAGAFVDLVDQSEKHTRSIIESADETSETSRKIRDLYASFMDTERIEELGTSVLTEDLAAIDAVQSIAELVALMGRLERAGAGGIFALWLGNDPDTPDEYIVNLYQDGLGLPDESYYREEQYEPIRQAYTEHLQRMWELAALPDPAGASERIFALETQIAAGHWDQVRSRDATLTTNRRSWRELVQANEFPWDVWGGALGLPTDHVDEVIVRQPSFVAALGELLTPEMLPSWQDWLRWQVLHGAAPLMPEAFVAENFAFYGSTLSGTPELRPRWKRGVSLVESVLGEAVGELYVAEHFPPAAKTQMQDLVQRLVQAYRESITGLEWMTPETQQRALEKLELFTPKIGYPDVWRDYAALEIDPADLLGNSRRAAEFEINREFSKLGKPVNRDEWLMTPQTVNAYYHPGMNEIVFPAAILQPPFFDPHADAAVNYGGIGAVIGHEIGHGFDDQGSKYDGYGALVDWWTEADRAAFDTRTQALIQQFDELFPAQVPDEHVNGAFTVGENIGDLGGLSIAYRAYQLSLEGKPAPVIDGLTGDQRFFISWAQVWRGKVRDEEVRRRLATDPHSPPEFRCNQIARNIPEFHEAFGVTDTDKMWLQPADRVKIW